MLILYVEVDVVTCLFSKKKKKKIGKKKQKK